MEARGCSRGCCRGVQALTAALSRSRALPLLAQAYAGDPSWAAKGPALLAAPRLAGGRLVVQLTSAKEAPKAVENFRWAGPPGSRLEAGCALRM